MAIKAKSYYLGLDIGTDSVGYAATDELYNPLKFKGEPVMGVTTFEAANNCQERRAFRSSRRRIDRRQQRVDLITDLFSNEIIKIDPRFFIRREESRLFRDETEDRYIQFNDPQFSDVEYYEKYPTIHHLILDLMQTKEAHDIRLVYIACAWLVAHRGHFLFDVPADDTSKLLDFNSVYKSFKSYFVENELPLPWSDTTPSKCILDVLTAQVGISRKKELFKEKIFGGKKPSKVVDDDCRYNREAICNLLSGAKIKPEDVFQTGEYVETESISLDSPEEDFARIVSELGTNGELFLRLRALYDCALLIVAQHGKTTVSEAKVAVYDQHQKDLSSLKTFIKKYVPDQYNPIFRDAGKENYTAYSYNVKSCKKPKEVSKAGKEVFSDYLLKIVKDITVEAKDETFFNDMKERLSIRTFLPKQKDTDNRVIPQQLYRYELKTILDNAENYLPFLSSEDKDGLSIKEKILSVFDFRIPYFVGPLNSKSNHAWIVRKSEGRIYPWNFNELIDLDKSEQAFIDRMTNSCSYLAGKKVLPVHSLLYCKFAVLNEINNLKINNISISVDIKQKIFEDLFMQKLRITRKNIIDYLLSNGYISKTDVISGVDERLNSSLSSYHQFKRLLSNKVLSEGDVEKIIEHCAYSEDKTRLLNWLEKEYPSLSLDDKKYISRLNLKEFGRLSQELLTGIHGAEKDSGEIASIMNLLWNRNINLMQLLSEKYTFKDEIEAYNKSYYSEHSTVLTKRLDEMYISNAVKRPIFRTLDICRDIVKATGCAPTKIFIEMARDVGGSSQGKRTMTRHQQLIDLYKKVKTDDARMLEKELANMGDYADNKLQSDALFLYYLQLGKCAYSGKPIDITKLKDGTYNIDHIYPQAFVKDDSILNNKVLVYSNINGDKKNIYPIDKSIRDEMHSYWTMLRNHGLMTDEKYKRLTRSTPFTDDERWGFINRQLVETRQSTKAVAELLKEQYPNAKIVYSKAGMVSEFRQEFSMLKCRSVNNLHHAKDAYLNIVVGNVYDSRFNRQWFSLKDNYSINIKSLFRHPVSVNGSSVWKGESDISNVRSYIEKNHIHVSRFSFFRHGGFFDQLPVKSSANLTPLKKDLNTEKYGGYNKPTASFFSLVKYTNSNKTDILFMPVELMHTQRYLSDSVFAHKYATETISSILGKAVDSVEILLNNRPIKIGTTLEADNLRLCLNGKSSGGQKVITTLQTPLILETSLENYVKRIESFSKKYERNKALTPNIEYDHLSSAENCALYDVLFLKSLNSLYINCPGNLSNVLQLGKNSFSNLSIVDQIDCLMKILSWFGSFSGGLDLTAIGGNKAGGSKVQSSMLSSWKKKYKCLYIVDSSASGLFEHKSTNLLELL